MKDLIELQDTLIEINSKSETLRIICDILCGNLSLKVNNSADEAIYAYNREKNKALIDIILDGICEIKKLSLLA